MSRSRPHVSDRDRAIANRQAARLRIEENADEGSAEWQRAVAEWVGEQRMATGDSPPLAWWENKPELEFHERARTLGLLD